MNRSLLNRTILVLTAAAVAVAATPATRDWWKHVEFLASDKLEGRGAGSAGHKKAAAYVTAQFRKAGAGPCFPGGSFVQNVPLIQKRLIEEQSSLSVTTAGRTRTLKLGDEAILSTRGELAESLEAGAVFAAYGMTVPEHNHNDFAGVDIRGKLAVVISGSPAHLPGTMRAHFSSAAEKSKALAAAGGIGFITVNNPKIADIPWARTAASRFIPQMSIDDAALSESGGARFGAALNSEKAAFLFEGTGHTLDELLALATAGKPLPHFALPAVFTARTKVEKTPLTSENVCGVIPGTDPALRGESVVLSAHLDHLGMAASGSDRVYNGAMDNASGIATLIETARGMKRNRPKRSVVLVAVTAEEKGLLGSRYFTSRLPPAVGRPVANLNFDMFLPLHAMKSVIAFGVEESSLREPLEQAAAAMGLKVLVDPEPQRNRFIRSDQYSFIQKGVPALALKVGFDPGTPEAEIQRQWTANRYHALGDDLAQPVDLEAAAAFNTLVARLAAAVANAPDRPHWNNSSFFRRFAEQTAPAVRNSQ